MADAVITDWDAAKATGFGAENLAFRHTLHERPMFADAGLAEVLDRYPRDKLGVFTMGEDPVDWRTWRRGTAGDLTGAQLLTAAYQGRIWLNLRAVNQVLQSYADLAREIFGDLESHVPGLKTFRHDVGLLISSPRAHVFYHLDATPVTLWQLRGRKRMWVYPREAPFVSAEQIEAVVLRERAEQFAFDLAWDQGADTFEMEPGVMVAWRQNAPHRLVNADCLNVSLSVEHLTPQALMRANVIFANGLMRRKLGARPALRDGYTPANLAKFGMARAAKALKLHAETAARIPPSFTLVAARPGAPAPL